MFYFNLFYCRNLWIEILNSGLRLRGTQIWIDWRTLVYLLLVVLYVQVMLNIDSNKAEATVAEDLRNIRSMIEQIDGQYTTIDNIFKTVLRKWIGETGQHIFSTLEDSDPLDQAMFARQVGTVLHGLGDYANAVEFYSQALDIRTRELGEAHIDTVDCHNSLGLTYDDMGVHAKALYHHEKCLAGKLSAFGAQHVSMAVCFNNLGNVHRNLKAWDKAIECYEQSLAIKLKHHTAPNAEMATTYNNLGLVCHDMGNDTAAMEHFRKSMAIYTESLGADHPDTVAPCNSLGVALQKTGNVEEAMRCYKLALDARLKVGRIPSLHTRASPSASTGRFCFVRVSPSVGFPQFLLCRHRPCWFCFAQFIWLRDFTKSMHNALKCSDPKCAFRSVHHPTDWGFSFQT